MPSLAKISTRFEQACSAIDRRIVYALKLDPTDNLITNSVIAFCVVKLHDQWNARCRELIIRSARGNCETLTGTVLPRSTRINPIQQLRNTWSKKSTMSTAWEPDWHVPEVSIRAAGLLGIANYEAVTNAFAAITIMEEMRWTRNAIAHELPRTYQQFRHNQALRFAISDYCPAEYAVQRIPETADMIIDIWMNEMMLALRAAIR
jgi:hypothetical protein